MQENPLQKNREVSREEIERRAFEIYVESGRQDGYDVEHWLAAEQQLLAEAAESGPTDQMHAYERATVQTGKAAAA